MKQSLEMLKITPPREQARVELAIKHYSTSIVKSILDLLSKFGDVNQQKLMLTRVLDHKSLSAIQLDHCLSFKDVAAATEIVENVKARL